MTQSTFEERVEAKLDLLAGTLEEVRDDVTIIKAKDYDGRLRRVEGKQSAHGERLAAAEVRAGLISVVIGGIVAFFFGAQNG